MAAMGELELAEKSYHQALKHRPLYADCQYNLGNLYVKMRQPDKAMDALSTSVLLNPKKKHAWTNLIILADEQQDFYLAGELALEAIKEHPLRPNSTPIWATFMASKINLKRPSQPICKA